MFVNKNKLNPVFQKFVDKGGVLLVVLPNTLNYFRVFDNAMVNK